jgi:DNA-directed RNA polymerase specialized sigma24 family protein
MNSNLSAQYLSRPNEFQRLVMHAFGLRSELRKVFLLCEVRGCTIEETARILGITTTVATLRLDRARREVKARLATR